MKYIHIFLFFCIIFFSCKEKNEEDTDGVNRIDQIITFAPISEKRLTEKSFKLQATSSSGLSILFESSDSSIASVSGNTVNMHRPGNISITAFQPGNESYNPATPVEQILLIKPPLLASYETDLFLYHYRYINGHITTYEWMFKLNGIPLSRSLTYNDWGKMIEDASTISTKQVKKSGNIIIYGSEKLTLDGEGKLLLIEGSTVIEFEYDDNGNLLKRTEYTPDDKTILSIEVHEDYDSGINPFLGSKPRWWFTYTNQFFASNNPRRLIKTENDVISIIHYGYEYNSFNLPLKRTVLNQETGETHTEIFLYEEPKSNETLRTIKSGS